MNEPAYPPAADATVVARSEADFAARLAADGEHVRAARGRFWIRRRRGFYEPVHLLARLDPREAMAPGRCWGYRAALQDGYQDVADAALPLHLMRDLAGYGEARLPKDARRALARMARAGVAVVSMTDDRLLVEQGYDVMMEWRARVGLLANAPTRDAYLARVRGYVTDEASIVLAALDAGQLLGYVVATVVAGSAHLLESKVRTESLRLGVGIALDHESLLALQRSGVVSEVSAGPHQPELPKLTDYKVRHGFPIVRLPAVARIPRIVGFALSRRQPRAYYRLTGRLPHG